MRLHPLRLSRRVRLIAIGIAVSCASASIWAMPKAAEDESAEVTSGTRVAKPKPVTASKPPASTVAKAGKTTPSAKPKAAAKSAKSTQTEKAAKTAKPAKTGKVSKASKAHAAPQSGKTAPAGKKAHLKSPPKNKAKHAASSAAHPPALHAKAAHRISKSSARKA